MIRQWSGFLLLVFLVLVVSLLDYSEYAMPDQKPGDFKFFLVSNPGLVVKSEQLNDKEINHIYQELKSMDIMSYPVELHNSPENRFITPQITRTLSLSWQGKIKTIKWIKDGWGSRAKRLNMLNEELTTMVKNEAWYWKMVKSAPILS